MTERVTVRGPNDACYVTAVSHAAPAHVHVSPHGRWRGALTSRPLPEDESIEAMNASDRSAVADMWLARAASERRVGDAFVVVTDALTRLRADESLVALARRAVDDEMRHAELSRRMAVRYASSDLEHPSLLPLDVPKHRGASDELRAVLHVVGHCCLNETLASAFLEAEIARVTAPTGHAALRELLSDEVDHARLGWATLSSVDASTRAAVAPWLPEMAVANLRMWRTAPRGYTEAPALLAHGAADRHEVDRALRVGLRDLVLPGFAHLGFDVAPLARWLDDGAPT